MPTEILRRNGRVAPELPLTSATQDEDDAALREHAVRHVEHVRKFKLYLAVYVLSMIALTPIWIVTQYETQDGWLKHLSTRSRYPGDWDPWLIWAGLVGGFLVALAGLRAYFSRRNPEEDVAREIERMKTAH